LNSLEEVHAFFLDYDGTLVNSIDCLYSAYIETLSILNIKGSLEEFNLLNGPSLEEIAVYLKKKHNLNRSTKSIIDIHSSQIEARKNLIKPLPYADELLMFLKTNNKEVSLVTSSQKEQCIDFLIRHGWTDYFTAMTFGNEVKTSKPNPEIYLLAQMKSKIAKNKVLAIEDSKNGVQAARRAGLQTYQVLNNGHPSQEILSDIKKFKDLEDLLNYLQSLR
jgi:HAD superfamily hydrolase (TIGR01509 family)